MVAALCMEVCYNLSQDGGKGTSVFFYQSYQNTYSGCSRDRDCYMTDPTKRRCMHGMCYGCVTSADCTPPNTCDPPPDGDGTCGFELGLFIISKERWRKGTTQTTHPPRYDREFASSSTYDYDPWMQSKKLYQINGFIFCSNYLL